MARKESENQSGREIGQTRMRSLLVAAEIALALIARGASRSRFPQRAHDADVCCGEALYERNRNGSIHSREHPTDRRIAGCGKLDPVLLPSAGDHAAVAAEYPRPLAGRAVSCRCGLDFRFAGLFRNPSHTVAARPTVTERDNASAPGVVVSNEILARRLWLNGDPLNDRLLIGRTLDPAYGKDPERQIVGNVRRCS